MVTGNAGEIGTVLKYLMMRVIAAGRFSICQRSEKLFSGHPPLPCTGQQNLICISSSSFIPYQSAPCTCLLPPSLASCIYCKLENLCAGGLAGLILTRQISEECIEHGR